MNRHRKGDEQLRTISEMRDYVAEMSAHADQITSLADRMEAQHHVERRQRKAAALAKARRLGWTIINGSAITIVSAIAVAKDNAAPALAAGTTAIIVVSTMIGGGGAAQTPTIQPTTSQPAEYVRPLESPRTEQTARPTSPAPDSSNGESVNHPEQGSPTPSPMPSPTARRPIKRPLRHLIRPTRRPDMKTWPGRAERRALLGLIPQ